MGGKEGNMGNYQERRNHENSCVTEVMGLHGGRPTAEQEKTMRACFEKMRPEATPTMERRDKMMPGSNMPNDRPTEQFKTEMYRSEDEYNNQMEYHDEYKGERMPEGMPEGEMYPRTEGFNNDKIMPPPPSATGETVPEQTSLVDRALGFLLQAFKQR